MIGRRLFLCALVAFLSAVESAAQFRKGSAKVLNSELPASIEVTNVTVTGQIQQDNGPGISQDGLDASIITTTDSVGGVTIITSSNGVPGTYVRKSTLPIAGPSFVAEFGIASHAGKIYKVGGFDTTPVLASPVMHVYDPVTDAWSTLPPMPTPRRGLSFACAWNDKCYAIGGTTGTAVTEVATGLIEEYDPQANSWATKSTYISSRAFAVVAATRTIYIAGGCDRCNGGNASNKLEIYNPEADALMGTPATMGTGRYAAAGGIINGAFYIAGGINGSNQPLASIEKWTSNAWETKTEFGAAFASAAYAVGGENLYIAAGKQGGALSSVVAWYNAGADAWRTEPGIMEVRYLAGGAYLGRDLYVIGGYDANGAATGVNHRYGPTYIDTQAGDVAVSSASFLSDGRSDIYTPTGFGNLTLTGPMGGCQIFRDIDNSGWTKVYYINGSQTVMVDQDGRCD